MKRNFKVIKQDKNLSNLSDADIDKLYSTYIEMDGKHQNFKGSKREYCSTVAGMIKEWLKEVVDKNGGIRDKSLIGGKGRRKKIDAVVKKKEKEIEELQLKITKLTNDKTVLDKTFLAIPEKIKKKEKELETYKNEYVEPELTKANKTKFDEMMRLDKESDTLIEKYQGINKEFEDTKIALSTASASSKKEMQEKVRNLNLEGNAIVARHEAVNKKIKELREEPILNRKWIEADIDNVFKIIKTQTENITTCQQKALKEKNKTRKKDMQELIELQKQELEGNKQRWKDRRDEYLTLVPENEKVLKEIEDLNKQKTVLATKSKELIAEIKKNKEEKTLKESDLPNVEKEKEEAYKKLEAEKKEKFKTHTSSLYTGLSLAVQTDEMLDEAYKYRRVIDMLLGYKLYEPSRLQHNITATKNFLRALPYKKIMEISREGHDQRVEFLKQIITEDTGMKKSDGTPITWTRAVEESFRTESFVFWTLLARNVKDKQKNVYNFELLGKIFSKALYFDPVDFKTSYFTGDSKGVITTSVQAKSGIPRDAVVSVRKIFAILEESAYLNSSRRVSFNNPNIIFTFYRSNDDMMKYYQVSEGFGGDLPYEMLLKYDLSILLTPGPLLEELKRHIAQCKMMSHIDKNKYMSSTAVSTTIEKLLKNHYNNTDFCFENTQGHRTVSLPVGPRAGVTKAVETQLESDLEIVGYSREIFGDIENPTVKHYSDIYARKEKKIIDYTGSRIDKFVFKQIIPPTAVIKDIVIEDDDGDDGGDITVLSTSEVVVPATDSPATGTTTSEVVVPATGTTPSEGVALSAGPGVGADISDAALLTRTTKKPITQMSDEAKALQLQTLAVKAAAKALKEANKKAARKAEKAEKAAKEAAKKALEEASVDNDDDELTALEEAIARASAAAKKDKNEGEGKPKSYIKKIIKYYQ